MADLLQIVCCLCGDVGFTTELFRCVNNCCNRFQHSYCSNYYGESTKAIELCDWCRSEERSGLTNTDPRGHLVSGLTKSVPNDENRARNRPKYFDDKTTQKRRDDGFLENKKNSGGVSPPLPPPRPATRRYKLLKDVMC